MNIFDRLQALTKPKPQVLETAAADDGEDAISTKKSRQAKRLELLEAEVAHYRKLLDGQNYDKYQRVFVEAITNKSTAIAANNSYTMQVLMEIPVSLPSLTEIVSGIVTQMKRHGVEPALHFTDFVSTYRTLSREAAPIKSKKKMDILD